MSARFSHPIARAKERYGLALGAADMESLERRVTQGDYVLIRRQAGRDIVMMKHEATVLLAVVEPLGTRIVTFLGPDQHRRARLRPQNRKRLSA